MKMKKVLVVLLALTVAAGCIACFTACDNNRDDDLNEITLPAYSVDAPDYSNLVIPNDFKIGMICLHDENSTYDKNFIDAMKATQAKFKLSDDQVKIVTGIPEGDECYQKAVELADDGCDIVFADSFGHEAYLVKAAKKYNNVLFAHATGTTAHTENLDNFVNAFASIYEGRYLAGVAAGMKLNEMIKAGKFAAKDAKIGYVGAFTYAEVISGYTSFYLGAKSVCPSVTMEVTFTGSWYDEQKEYNSAKKLINNGCKLISQHADSMGAPNACEEAGVPNISYNGSTLAACPNTFIVSSSINWAPYFEYIIASKVKGEAVQKDWTGTIKTGSVRLTNVGGNAAAEGTVEKIVEVREKIVKGEIKVFDTNNFTVNGAKLTTYLADVNTDAAFTPDTEVIINGVFEESKFRSAPYFNLKIDGITLLDVNFG